MYRPLVTLACEGKYFYGNFPSTIVEKITELENHQLATSWKKIEGGNTHQ